MNTLQLILKNMRQRALSTWLTMLSVALGVALAIAVILFYREGDKLFVQSDFGYNVLIGPKGDDIGLIFNSVYGLGMAKGSIPWSVHQELMTTQQQSVRWAMPFMVGDTSKGKRIMATSSRLVNSSELDAFRDALGELTIDLRTVGRPANNETPETRDERVTKVPSAIDAATKAIAPIDEATLAPLDRDLVARFEELKASLVRARAMIDPAKPAMTDAAGRIAADAVDQLRLLGQFATPFEYRAGKPLELASGKAFDARKFEGVIGSNVATTQGLKVGDKFQLEHGGNAKDVHEELWTVTGILKPTGTAIDDTLFISLVSGMAIPEHEEGLKSIAKLANPNADLAPPAATKPDEHADHDHAAHADGDLMADTKDEHAGHDHAGHDHGDHAYDIDDGRIDLHLPQSQWRLSGIFVGTRGEGQATQMLQFQYMNTPVAMAVPVASTMSKFFHTFLTGPTYVLLALAVLVTVVAAVSILVSIYNAVSARRREIAILRALGATKGKVLSLIVFEAAVVGLLGAIIGLVVGHALAGIGSGYLQRSFGHAIDVFSVSPLEIAYIAGVIVIAGLAGLVPALQAYRVPVAQNLVAE